MHLTGSYTCRNLTYTLSLASPSDARTSLCHCRNCKKAFGTNYGLTGQSAGSQLRLHGGVWGADRACSGQWVWDAGP